METAVVIVISGLLLCPLIFVLVAFRLIFPRHAVKIKEVFLIPIALLIVITFDSYFIYILCKWIPANVESLTSFLTWLRPKPNTEFLEFFKSVLFLLLLCFCPFICTLICSWFALICYGWIYKTKRTTQTVTSWWGKAIAPVQLIVKVTAGIVKNQILNHFGQATYFDKENDQLMVDVMGEDEFLYSGIYSDFFMDDGKFSGVSITNVLRYCYRHDPSGNKLPTELYLIPNGGELFIPSERINNMHFWKLSREDNRTETLRDNFSAVYIPWLLSVSWSSNLKNPPKIFANKSLDIKLQTKFVREFKKTKVPVTYLKGAIEFII